ncbi:hypothetical protein VQ042_09855 [Aurantimonas sp. A2-1-M11]|uniref:hypothetical protein n=1 Tax=Aurantimonas sp. A2-1-M11 TaxID=3113712 RepID=UPI002F93D5C5
MVTKKVKTPSKRIDPDPPKLAPHVLAEMSPRHRHSRNAIEILKINEIAELLFSPAGEPEERKFARIQHARELYEALESGMWRQVEQLPPM